MEMAYVESESCTFYEFSSKAFPRLHFLQHNLISFYPRFWRTVVQSQNRKSHSLQSADMLMNDIKPVLNEVNEFLQCVNERLKTLSHLQFELNKILESIRNKGQKLPDKRDKFEFFTKQLMQMDDLQGCGDYFGTLLIFIAKENTTVKEQEVRKKIENCLSGYPYDYDIKYSTNLRTFANPNKDGAGHQNQQSCIKAGDKIHWVDKMGKPRHGTVGMFVRGNHSVYLITNRHVVTGEGKCYICVQDKSYQELGSVKWESCDGSLDIDAVKVNSNMLGNCSLHYENLHGEQCIYVILQTSKDTLEDLVGNKVYKRGAETGLTEGIISSKSIQMKKEGIIKPYNSLISPLPGSKPEEAQFAKEGDSGSVVTLHTADQTTVKIMGMLIGKFEPRLTQEKREISMSQDSQASVQTEETLYLTFSLKEGLDILNSMDGLNIKVEFEVISPLPGSTLNIRTLDIAVEIMGMPIGEFEARPTQEDWEASIRKHYLAFYLMDGLISLISSHGLNAI